MAKDKVTIALVGAGFIGEIHARNLSRHADVYLKYVIEPSDALGKKVSQATGATWITDADSAPVIME